MYEPRQFKKGLKIEIDGVPFSVVECQHVSPGKGNAFTRTRLKNLMTSNTVEKTFKSNEKIAPADVVTRDMQFLYIDSSGYNFMDNTTYEQITLDKELLGEAVGYLQENIVTQVMLWDDRPIGIELPNSIEGEVIETEPAIKGDTVSGGTKPAKITTGAMVQVPFHIKEGDMIRVDTRTASYLEKVNK